MAAPSVPPPLAPLASPLFPPNSCPWGENQTSGEDTTLVCWDGYRCDFFNNGWGCCDCHGGRALCPLMLPMMCRHASCGRDHCCDVNCDTAEEGGRRTCDGPDLTPINISGACTPLPPHPPFAPPLPPSPPLPPTDPYVFDWQQLFQLIHPPGAFCLFSHYTNDVDYRMFHEPSTLYSSQECANMCLRDAECTGFETPGARDYCALWFLGKCNSSTSPGMHSGPTSGSLSRFEYVRKSVPPPPPPLLPFPPAPPPLPSECTRICNGTQMNAELQCDVFLPLSCHEVHEVTATLGCGGACDGCCTEHPPSSPPPLPAVPSPSQPPPPVFPLEGCPWINNATSNEHAMLICFDGTQCSLLHDGLGCCDCHQGRAICPPNEPQMCAMKGPDGGGFDYSCRISCAPRPCDSPPIALPPGYCGPSPPAPPALPPAPPKPPQPPTTPYVLQWYHHFETLKPEGISCYQAYYEETDYELFRTSMDTQQCANLCLQSNDCTGFEAPGAQTYCMLWKNGACNSTSSPGIGPVGPKQGPNSYIEYVRVSQKLLPPSPLPPPLPPSPPAHPPPPSACDLPCNASSGGSVACSSFLTLACDELERVTTSLGCLNQCDGCCAMSPPSTPPPESHDEGLLSRIPNHTGTVVAFVLVFILFFTVICFLRHSQTLKRTSQAAYDAQLLSFRVDRRPSEALVEMSLPDGKMRYVELETLLREAVASMSGFGGKIKGLGSSAKFTTDTSELVVGKYTDAVLGISHFMRVPEALVLTGMTGGVAAIVAEFERVGNASDLECLHYVMHERAGSSTKLFPNSAFPRDCDAHGVRADRKTATGEGFTLDDFVAHPHAKQAKLGRAHVVALRCYTTAAFSAINTPLRDLATGVREEPHDLPVTVALIHDAIKKLRAVVSESVSGATERPTEGSVAADAPDAAAVRPGSPPPVDSPPVQPASRVIDLWRGLKDVSLDSDSPFLRDGGTELAPLSTTPSLQVALQYAASSSPVLLRLRVYSFMQRGADVAWISAFPEEEERLFPPLTFLEPKGRPKKVVIEGESGRPATTITVVTVVPHMGT